jgi:hypothetical protein
VKNLKTDRKLKGREHRIRRKILNISDATPMSPPKDKQRLMVLEETLKQVDEEFDI